MRRDLTADDKDKITQAILVGDRIEATSIYISITEQGLTEAHAFIRTLTTEVESTHPERHTAKLQKKRNIWQRLIFPVKE
jgi:hypothetical protein